MMASTSREGNLSKKQEMGKIPLRIGWKKHMRSAVLHVISLAQYTTIHTWGWTAGSSNKRVRLKAELDRANQEIALLREELRIKDPCVVRIDSHRRPHCPPPDRMAILQLRAARSWASKCTSDANGFKPSSSPCPSTPDGELCCRVSSTPW